MFSYPLGTEIDDDGRYFEGLSPIGNFIGALEVSIAAVRIFETHLIHIIRFSWLRIPHLPHLDRQGQPKLIPWQPGGNVKDVN